LILSYVFDLIVFYSCFIHRLQIEESTKPLRFSQKLEKAITTNYKPVSNHSYNVSVCGVWVFPTLWGKKYLYKDGINDTKLCFLKI